MTLAERWKTLPMWVRWLLTLADKYLNVRLGGVPGETISERLGKLRDLGNPSAKAACELLDKYDKGHCDRAVKYASKGNEF